MGNSTFFVSLGTGALALALTIGCSSTDPANGAGAAGDSAEGGAQSAAGSTSIAGSTTIAGTSGVVSASGGALGSGGSSSGGGNGTGAGCSTLTTEAACKAVSGCYPMYVAPPCANSAQACPLLFSSCANTGCGPSCGAGSVCAGVTFSGGGVEFPDAGVCPKGTHLAGQTCQNDPTTTFSCKPAPAACNGRITCACASSACSGSCQSAENNQIDCVELVP